MKLFGGIEAGGTNINCIIASSPNDIRAETRFGTSQPVETLEKVADFFKTNIVSIGERIHGIGIACFGPLDLDPMSANYGYITSTPKQGWEYTDVLGFFRGALGLPVVIDTDVNMAAVGEYTWGAARGMDDFIYLTIGTGIGGGGLFNGSPMHGLVHPEMGHIRLPHDWQTDPFDGICPYHGDCFEGLASGPAIRERWTQSADSLPPQHPAWDLEAYYIAMALNNYICTLSPKLIILGGGVMKQHHLFPLIREKVKNNLNDYVKSPLLTEGIEKYIAPPGLGDKAGVLGAVALIKKVTESI